MSDHIVKHIYFITFTSITYRIISSAVHGNLAYYQSLTKFQRCSAGNDVTRRRLAQKIDAPMRLITIA